MGNRIRKSRRHGDSAQSNEDDGIGEIVVALSVVVALLICCVGVVIGAARRGDYWLIGLPLAMLVLVGGIVLIFVDRAREDAAREKPTSEPPRLISKPRPPRPRAFKKVPGPLSRSWVEPPSPENLPAPERPEHPSRETDPEEVRRLRAKVAELKVIIARANEERSELRAQLTEVTAQRADEIEDRSESEDRASSPPEDSGIQLAGVIRRPLIPTYSTRAGRAARDLPPRIIRDVLLVVAALGAGEEAAWRATKQLVRPDGVIYSARVSIRYRVLFTVQDGALDVIDVIHRKELESTVSRIG